MGVVVHTLTVLLVATLAAGATNKTTITCAIATNTIDELPANSLYGRFDDIESLCVRTILEIVVDEVKDTTYTWDIYTLDSAKVKCNESLTTRVSTSTPNFANLTQCGCCTDRCSDSLPCSPNFVTKPPVTNTSPVTSIRTTARNKTVEFTTEPLTGFNSTNSAYFAAAPTTLLVASSTLIVKLISAYPAF